MRVYLRAKWCAGVPSVVQATADLFFRAQRRSLSLVAGPQGQVSLKANEVVLIEEEQDDGWCTVVKKDQDMGFAPVAYLDKTKGKKKGTLFGKKKATTDPPPPIPPFGTAPKPKSDRGALLRVG